MPLKTKLTCQAVSKCICIKIFKFGWGHQLSKNTKSKISTNKYFFLSSIIRYYVPNHLNNNSITTPIVSKRKRKEDVNTSFSKPGSAFFNLEIVSTCSSFKPLCHSS